MIYFDNAATGAVCGTAKEWATKAIEEFGNPSSPHKAGRAASELLASARNQVAISLGCKADRILFTSGGTEANNLAIFSAATKNFRAGKKIITNNTEHPSVAEPVKALEKQGFQIVYVPVLGGVPDYGVLESHAGDACLVAFMQANNQTGCLFDVEKIRQILTDTHSKALFHCDGVQSFCKTDKAGLLTKYCDTVSASSHKIGGFKGCGCLYFGEKVKLSPMILGGDQENGFRGGTENTVGICAFAGACAERSAHPEYLEKTKELREYFISLAKDALGDKINIFIPAEYIDCIVNFSINGLSSEVCLNYLSSKDICVSSSSACSVRAKKNTVLPAYGLNDKYVSGAVRVGLSHENTKAEVEALVSALKESAKFAR